MSDLDWDAPTILEAMEHDPTNPPRMIALAALALSGQRHCVPRRALRWCVEIAATLGIAMSVRVGDCAPIVRGNGSGYGNGNGSGNGSGNGTGSGDVYGHGKGDGGRFPWT